MAKPKVVMVCAHCGSDNVALDAWAKWDEDAQDWVLGSTYDQHTCLDCEKETSEFDEIPVEDYEPYRRYRESLEEGQTPISFDAWSERTEEPGVYVVTVSDTVTYKRTIEITVHARCRAEAEEVALDKVDDAIGAGDAYEEEQTDNTPWEIVSVHF